jgi:hypothetical protein
MSSLPLYGIGFQRRMFPFDWIPEFSLVSDTGFYQQHLAMIEHE